MSRIGTESAFEVLARARALEAQGRSIIHLENRPARFPDATAHRRGRQARTRRRVDGIRADERVPGFPRGDCRLHLADAKLRVGAEQVVVVPGGKPIMFFTMMAVVEPGDEVIYPNPGFPIYESVIRFLGATPVPMPLVESRGFSFDLDTFASKLSSRTRMVILNSPANPTGASFRETTWRASRSCCATETC
jgi:aspartate/methionine/tyrosine aminotransferase